MKYDITILKYYNIVCNIEGQQNIAMTDKEYRVFIQYFSINILNRMKLRQP